MKRAKLIDPFLRKVYMKKIPKELKLAITKLVELGNLPATRELKPIRDAARRALAERLVAA